MSKCYRFLTGNWGNSNKAFNGLLSSYWNSKFEKLVHDDDEILFSSTSDDDEIFFSSILLGTEEILSLRSSLFSLNYSKKKETNSA